MTFSSILAVSITSRALSTWPPTSTFENKPCIVHTRTHDSPPLPLLRFSYDMSGHPPVCVPAYLLDTSTSTAGFHHPHLPQPSFPLLDSHDDHRRCHFTHRKWPRKRRSDTRPTDSRRTVAPAPTTATASGLSLSLRCLPTRVSLPTPASVCSWPGHVWSPTPPPTPPPTTPGANYKWLLPSFP
jgi:hypothetical protein